MESSKQASKNLVCAVNIYMEVIEDNNLFDRNKIDSILENFSGHYFGWGDSEVESILEELSKQSVRPNTSQILNLINSYQRLIETRADSFDTLLYFLITGILIQFIFLIITNYRARSVGEKLRNSEEILKLLNSERENERLRISSMLHDSVLQDIGSLLLSPGMENNESAAEELRKISAELREMTYLIAPLQIKTSGFKDAAEDLINYFRQKNSCSVKLSINGYNENMLNNEARLVFYRILQESLTNIEKHAQASNVEITIVASHPFLIMRVRDDGIGIKAAERSRSGHSRKHIGMLIMNEQAKSIGAVMQGESEAGHGTIITLTYRLENG